LSYLTLPPGWTGSYTCPALRPYQLEAETSTKALVACSNLPTQIWSALSCSLPPDFRNLSGHRCWAPPPRQGGWPRWGPAVVKLQHFVVSKVDEVTIETE